MSDADVAAQWGATLQTERLGEIDLRFASAGQGPLIILVHGFPESWYSWRHQLGPLARAGFRVVAPDVRGYGGSSRPQAVTAYDMEQLTGDMRALADRLSPDEPVVIIGHDWGAPIAWNTAWLHPQRIRAVAGLSVPHVPPGEIPGIDVFKRVFTDKGRFFYMVYFQDEGVAEAELEADPLRSIRLFYSALGGEAAPGTWPTNKRHGDKLFDGVSEPEMPLPWFGEQDLAYYAGQFERSGFRGPLNRYRNFARDHAWLRARGDGIIHQPSLYMVGDRDLVMPMYPAGPIESMRPYMTDLRTAQVLEGCGHWIQQERADAVNQGLLDWLGTL
ncbi:MAG: alpha/beta hydrolase [Burkholderiaceae bacterium]